MPKNKTKKFLKKQKKIKGGFECNMCDPEDRRSTRLSETLCGKEPCRMCKDCAKKSCISTSLPEYRNQEAKQPKCPYCNEISEEVTRKCLDITNSETIEDMISREKSRLPIEPPSPQEIVYENPLEILDHYNLGPEADALEDIIAKYNAISMVGIPYLIKKQMLPVGNKQNYVNNLGKLFYETSYEFSEREDSEKYGIFDLISAYNQQVATNRQLGNIFQEYRYILIVIKEKIGNIPIVSRAIADYLSYTLPSNTHNILSVTLHQLAQFGLNRDYFLANYFDVDDQLASFNIAIETSIRNINENILRVFTTLINQILSSRQNGGKKQKSKTKKRIIYNKKSHTNRKRQ